MVPKMEKKVIRGKVIIVMPAYNASATLEKTFMDIPSGIADQVILVDDGSKDDKGYGSNQNTCYREALAQGADVIVMLHPDYQYDSRLIPYFLGYIEMAICDIMLGSRIRSRREALEGGMLGLKKSIFTLHCKQIDRY
jgi:glycosyltransferase involved in cell wall biosynthesis